MIDMPNRLHRSRQLTSRIPYVTRRNPRRARPPSSLARHRTAEILTISVLVSILVLLGLGAMLWTLDNGIAFLVTATPTATGAATPTQTADFRATHTVEDLATQLAYQIALAGRKTPIASFIQETPLPSITVTGAPQTPSPIPNETPAQRASPSPTMPRQEQLTPDGTPVSLPATEAPGATVTPIDIPTSKVIVVPIISNNSSTPTPAATATEISAATATSTEPATPIATQPAAQPTATPTVQPLDTPTPLPPTETPTPASPTATATQTPTPEPFRVDSLHAVVSVPSPQTETELYVGPSALYTTTGALANGTDVQLRGRNATGEWVLVCCIDGNTAWMRQIFAEPVDNPLQPGAPQDSNPNDVRWLPLEPISSQLPPLFTPTPIPAQDYPLYRYNIHNTGYIAHLPKPPLVTSWPPAQAAQALISPVAISNASVIVASADNHLYSFDRTNGNQRWRFNIGQQVRMAPAVDNGHIYVADVTGRIFAFEDRGNEAVQIWQSSIAIPPVSSFNIISDTLFISGMKDTDHRVFTINRDDGTIIRTFTTTGNGLQYPTLGDQLLYVADGNLVALDLYTNEVVWVRDDIGAITTPPAYSSPGVKRLAELYVATGNNRIFSLNANTGKEIWNFNSGEPATGLAVNKGALFVSGNGYVKAISRDTGEQLWRAAVNGPVLGGPLVDDTQILALTQSGAIFFLDSSTGNTLGAFGLTPAAGAPAVSENQIFAPGNNGGLYAMKEGQ